MNVTSDEARLRQMFDDLTASQPEPPSDRYRRVRGRAVRHRWNQAAGAMAIILVAAGVIAAGLTGVGGPPSVPATRPVPAWALPWPDHRNNTVPQKVLNGAVAAWRRAAAQDQGVAPAAVAKASVIWYVGQTAVHGQVVVVMFETDSAAGRRLVAGWATASEVMNGQHFRPGSSPWVLYDVAAPRLAPGLTIGLNVHGASRNTERNPDNWIVVLANPRVRSMSLSGSGSHGPGSSTAVVGTGSTRRGLLVGDVGQITAPIELTGLELGHHDILPAPPGLVGVPGSQASQVPQLAMPAPIGLPHGFTSAIQFAGQGNTGSGLYDYQGRLAIVARCYGPARLRLTYGTGLKETAIGTISCDDDVHELTTSVILKPHDKTAGVTVHTSGLTSYRVALGTTR